MAPAKSIAEIVEADQNPYRRAIALMKRRERDRDESTVTFIFHDGSTLTFDVVYNLRPGSAVHPSQRDPACCLACGERHGTKGLPCPNMQAYSVAQVVAK